MTICISFANNIGAPNLILFVLSAASSMTLILPKIVELGNVVAKDGRVEL